MRTCRTRVAALVVAAALAVSGCGGSGEAGGGAVALQSADGAPGADGPDGPDGSTRGGDGADGGDASSVSRPDGDLRACLTRNDAVVPWREQDVSKSTGWHRQGRQAAHVRVIKKVHARLGGAGKATPEQRLAAGFLGYDLDPVGSRLIMMIDPTRLEHAEFERWVGAVARQANKAANVQGPRLTVTVQDGCFPASAYEKLRATLLRDGRTSVLYGDVDLDGTVHAAFCGDAAAYLAQIRERFGPMLTAQTQCVHDV